MIVDAGKAAGLVFAAALLQVTIFSTLDVAGGTGDLLLVTVVCVALVRGSLAGAGAGFFAGLVFDTANLQTLGLTSLLLTLAGYWTGRYAETSGRDRAAAPIVAVAAVTIVYAILSLAVHALIGDPVGIRVALFDALAPALAVNALLALAVFPLVRAVFPPAMQTSLAREVELLG
jgi:rod shape-determining protein MreD